MPKLTLLFVLGTLLEFPSHVTRSQEDMKMQPASPLLDLLLERTIVYPWNIPDFNLQYHLHQPRATVMTPTAAKHALNKAIFARVLLIPTHL